jgi:hypothetical protein
MHLLALLMLTPVLVIVDPAPTLSLLALVFAKTPFASFGAYRQKFLLQPLSACHAELCFQTWAQLATQHLEHYAKHFLA